MGIRGAASAVAATGAMILVGGCGDDGDEPVPKDKAEAASKSALLLLTDFPEGWTSLPPATVGRPHPFDKDLPEDCLLLDLSENKESVAQSKSSPFVNDPESVTSYAAAYAEEEKAHARITGLRDAVNVCREPLREWLRRFAEEISGENLTLNIRDFSFEEMPFSSFGEESLALRTTIAVDGVERPTSVTTDLIVFRVGNVIAGLDYTTSDREADRALEERLMAIIEERTRQSAESLK